MAKKKTAEKKEKKEKVKEVLITKSTILKDFGWTEGMIKKFLPLPAEKSNPHYRSGPPMLLWPKALVEEVHSTPAVQEALAKKSHKQVVSESKIERRAREIAANDPNGRKLAKTLEIKATELAAALVLEDYDFTNKLEFASVLSRRFLLHVGPTNSGKTYRALEALKKAKTGVYLGPLRLLALEVSETLNEEGIKCSLLTGEEDVPVPGAGIVASTIEMLDDRHRYDVAIIDEAQMIADKERGGEWTKALLTVNAAEVHVCMAPEALNFIEGILKSIDAEYEVEHLERFTPLEFKGEFKDIKNAEKGDAFITFSRKEVLALAAELERHKKKVSVLYGALPPLSRREEVRKFVEGETDIVVATDCIGLGVNLRIRRVIMVHMAKFDGTHHRELTASEFLQIAGRAGRYGKHAAGEVYSMETVGRAKTLFNTKPRQLEKGSLPFPSHMVSSHIPLEFLLAAWNHLPATPLFKREDMSGPLHLLWHLKRVFPEMPPDQKFACITCPFDHTNAFLVSYWLSCCEAWFYNLPLPDVVGDETSLEACETKYRKVDIQHQMAHRMGLHLDSAEERERLCEKINMYLNQDKDKYLKKCSCCGTSLPFSYAYGMCQKCYNARYRDRWDYDDFDF